MAAPLSQESDISYATAISETSESEDEFLDVFGDEEWKDVPNIVEFNDFDESQSGPKHNLDENASVLDYFSLFWGVQLLNLIVNETNRSVVLILTEKS